MPQPPPPPHTAPPKLTRPLPFPSSTHKTQHPFPPCYILCTTAGTPHLSTRPSIAAAGCSTQAYGWPPNKHTPMLCGACCVSWGTPQLAASCWDNPACRAPACLLKIAAVSRLLLLVPAQQRRRRGTSYIHVHVWRMCVVSLHCRSQPHTATTHKALHSTNCLQTSTRTTLSPAHLYDAAPSRNTSFGAAQQSGGKYVFRQQATIYTLLTHAAPHTHTQSPPAIKCRTGGLGTCNHTRTPPPPPHNACR